MADHIPRSERTANLLHWLQHSKASAEAEAQSCNPIALGDVYLAAAAAACAPSDLAYLRRKRSTRPAVSTRRCLPVKNGWHLEQISTWMSPLWVDRVSKLFPQAHITRTASYLGWIFSLGIAVDRPFLQLFSSIVAIKQRS